MKYVRLSLSLPPETRNPMHQFVVDHEGYEASYLLRGNDIDEEVRTLLFYVDGHPIAPYREALEATEHILEYAISTCPGESFYLYVRDRLSETGRSIVDAVTAAELVGVSPVAFRADGTMALTLVGPGETVQRSVEAVPDGIAVDVREVGEYASHRFEPAAALTDRQFEAVAAAVDCGYYDEPREGSTAEVAEALDCSPGTAAEHLRKAEARVMGRLVEGDGPADPARADSRNP
ncbi:helix-turn-helix domain-containing protein [Haloarcula salinisoli]|uniref:Helix-turn-helix domain-containing protein n=1 Tax=Haloarcula salinisoli TaxID=2487746 RepID=A0A8J7YJ60_9EURY|nr:helix-turn-helix domain-containing protein [Halomicroarcula salinisoli]MBX0302183.1 helix-turn-helix domain-containing protein [Halomicroarcula salinisoli]